MLSYEVARNKMLNGMSPVEVYEDWIKSDPDATEMSKNHSKQAISFAWDECRKQSIRARMGRKA